MILFARNLPVNFHPDPIKKCLPSACLFSQRVDIMQFFLYFPSSLRLQPPASPPAICHCFHRGTISQSFLRLHPTARLPASFRRRNHYQLPPPPPPKPPPRPPLPSPPSGIVMWILLLIVRPQLSIMRENIHASKNGSFPYPYRPLP